MPEHVMNPLPIGTVVHERYLITAAVGRGGLGTVYQVADILYGKQNVYALKELVDQSPGARKQFELESQWLQSLDHNHIPKVREHFEWHQRLYLVMDFVAGENLEQKLMRTHGRPFSEDQTLRWILPICDALQYLHTRVPPILHRDVKPSNIIVTPSGHPVLVDLGIAKAHLPGANQTSTFVRKAGTEGYAPPEQYTATGQTGPWSDVYGLGATLYQLLTGRLPPTAVERVALDTSLMPPQQANPAISSWVSVALLRALALRPADRFQSVQAFAQALTGPTGRIAGMFPELWPATPTPSSTPLMQPNSSPPAAAQTTPPFGASTPGLVSSIPVPRNPLGMSTPALPITPPMPISKPTLRQSTSQQMAVKDRQTLRQLQAEANAAEQRGEESVGDGPQRPRSRWRSPWLWGSAACGLLLTMVIIGAILFNASAPPDRSNPRATATGYFAALKAQNYTLAWQYSSAIYTDATSESSFIANLRSDDAQFGPVQQVDISKMKIENESAGSVTVQVDVSRADNPNSPVTYTLSLGLYNGSLWLINNITAS